MERRETVKTPGSAGWFFKKGKARKVFPAKYNNRPKVPSNTDTPRARILSEEKLGGLGSSVLYRDHIKPPGAYLKPVDGKSFDIIEIPEIFKPETKLIFSQYVNVPESERPPIINTIYRRMQVRLEILNQRHTALERWHHFIPVNEKFYRLICCFSGATAFFLEHDEINCTVKMSRDYETSSARAIVQRKQYKRIVWFSSQRVG